MTLDEIKKAVESGKTVHWANRGYKVIKSKKTGEFLITFEGSDWCCGLETKNGQLAEDPKRFFIPDAKTH